MSTAVASRDSSAFGDQPIYISTATLVLKQSVVPADDYAWHTEVRTPTQPGAPIETEIQPTDAGKSTTAANPNPQQIDNATFKTPHLFTPSITYNESDDINTVLSKFMACERYHTEYNKYVNQPTIEGC